MHHEHRYKEVVGGLYADEANGPRTYHEIWWVCDCGKFSSNLSYEAMRRAAVADTTLET